MKKISYMVALIFISAVLWGGSLSAQDKGTYIDNASPQDSSYAASDTLNPDNKGKDEGSRRTAFLAGLAVAIVGGAIFVVLRKKKKE